MKTKAQPSPKKFSRGREAPLDKAKIAEEVLLWIEQGSSLRSACAYVTDASPSTFLHWCSQDPKLAEQYAAVCKLRYQLLADEILDIAAQTTVMTAVQATDGDGNDRYDANGQPILRPVHVPLNSDVNAHIKLQVDTRKWLLSKVMPKVYGDKVTQEHTGADGGAIQIAAMDFKGLSDDELNAMRTLMLKANGGSL